MGYLVNRLDNPKELEKEWSKLEKRAKNSREEYAAYKKAQREAARKAKMAKQEEEKNNSQ